MWGLDRAKELLVPVIAEDIFASEEIEKMLKLVGHPPELMNKSDQNAVEGEGCLQGMMDAEGPAVAAAVIARTHV